MILFNDLIHSHQYLLVLSLLVARGYGMLLSMPPLLKAGQSWLIRFPIASAISLPTFGYASQAATGDMVVIDFVLMGGREFLLGAISGLFFSPLFAVPRMIGAVIDQQAGLASVTLFDPTATERVSTLFADIFEQSALFLFFSAGGLAALSHAYMLSCLLWLPGSSEIPSLSNMSPLIFEGFSQMLLIILTYATPFVVMLVLIEYGIGLVGRAAPQMNILTTSISIKIAAVMIFMLLVTTMLADRYNTWLADTFAHSSHFFDYLTKK